MRPQTTRDETRREHMFVLTRYYSLLVRYWDAPETEAKQTARKWMQLCLNRYNFKMPCI